MTKPLVAADRSHERSPSPADRVAWMDAARVMAAVWVVTIHVAAVPVVNMKVVPPDWWWWANVYNASSRAAVPMFLMLSGALLLARPIASPGDFLRKRLLKLIPPMVGWSLLYVAWRMWLKGETVTASQVMNHLVDGLHQPAYPHLWFLWIIVGMYLLAPLLQPFITAASRATHVYVGLLWLFVTALKPVIESRSGIHIGVPLAALSGFIGYFLVGASFEKLIGARLTSRALAAACVTFVASVGATAWGTYVLSLAQGRSVNEFWLDPLSPSVIPMSLSAYLILRHLGSGMRASQARWMTWASALSFGIYLVHPMVIDLLDLSGLPLDPMPHNPAWYTPVMVVLVVVPAAALAASLRSTRLTRWLAP